MNRSTSSLGAMGWPTHCEVPVAPVDKISSVLLSSSRVAEPLDNAKAKKLITSILKGGTVSFTGHALREMAKDDMNEQDCLGVLRGGWVEFSELVEGTWRYRICTRELYVVTAFRSETELAIVTAWRLKR